MLMVLRGYLSELIFTSPVSIRARCMGQHSACSGGGTAWSPMISGFARKVKEDAVT
jgi:hypothetical protein